jgi:hypothetical protein
VEAGSRGAGEQPHRRRRRHEWLTPRMALDGAGAEFPTHAGLLRLGQLGYAAVNFGYAAFQSTFVLLGLFCTSRAILIGPTQLFPSEFVCFSSILVTKKEFV